VQRSARSSRVIALARAFNFKDRIWNKSCNLTVYQSRVLRTIIFMDSRRSEGDQNEKIHPADLWSAAGNRAAGILQLPAGAHRCRQPHPRYDPDRALCAHPAPAGGHQSHRGTHFGQPPAEQTNLPGQPAATNTSIPPTAVPPTATTVNTATPVTYPCVRVASSTVTTSRPNR